MFLEGYKRNWLHTEGYSFEDRMIDDLSVSVISHLLHLKFLFFIFLCHCSHFLSIWNSESNGARGRRWRRGKGNKAGSPAPAYSAFQSYCFNRKEVRQVLTGTTTLMLEMWCSHRATCLFLFTVVFSLPNSVNSIQIIFIWHMLTLWQRWVIGCWLQVEVCSVKNVL